MGRWGRSVRWLILATLVAGFDLAAMIRAVRQGRASHAVAEYAVGFGLVLLVANALVIWLAAYFAGVARRPEGQRLTSAPPPSVMAGLYALMVAGAVLSALFLTLGRF